MLLPCETQQEVPPVNQETGPHHIANLVKPDFRISGFVEFEKQFSSV